jgi:transposase
MAIVGGFDVHRKQITFDYLDIETGCISRGEIRPVCRRSLRSFLSRRFEGKQVAIALEATTGWRFVVEELLAMGVEVHLAEPADTRALRGPKKRAKNDREDARHLRELLHRGQLPESWIPPAHIQELRTLVRLRKNLIDERRQWKQRIQAALFHQGLPSMTLNRKGRARLPELGLSPAAQIAVQLAVRMIEALEVELKPLERQLWELARRIPACLALMANHYGIGLITAVAIVAEYGDASRISNSGKAVRCAGLDITVWESDGKRAPGHLSRQGPEVLRWALFEAAQCACRKASPDHAYYQQVKSERGHNQACLSVARKLMRRAHHTLRELGSQALDLEPAA